MNDGKAYAVVVESIADIARLITRYAEIERLYIGTTTQISTDLEQLIIKLYTNILEYELHAYKYFERNTLGMVLI